LLKLPDNSKIFLTGGTGFLGRTLLDELLATHNDKVEIHILCRDPDAFKARYPSYANQPTLRFLKGDILHELEPECNYSHVIHAAADTHAASINPVSWIKQIAFGTENILEFAVQAKAKRFLFLSSGAIYGPQPQTLSKIPEDFSGAPSTTSINSIYGQAKRLAEQICTSKNHSGQIETVIARCFAFGGKHVPLDGPYAFGNFIRDALWRDKIVVQGDGSATRSYLAGEDMARWLLTMMLIGRAGEAYNVGSDQPVTMFELAGKMRDLLAPNKEVVVENRSGSNTHRSVYLPSIEKAGELGLRPEITLSEMIHKTAIGLKNMHAKNNA
jgi:UDP-glucuronate decarboxylase